MNYYLQEYARTVLIEGLRMLGDDHNLIFEKMYKPLGVNASTVEIVYMIAEDRLDHAMLQVIDSVYMSTIQLTNLELKIQKSIIKGREGECLTSLGGT